jgi:hypothetical protein
MTAGDFVQAQHIAAGSSGAHYRDGAYLRTHADHRQRSHAGGNG